MQYLDSHCHFELFDQFFSGRLSSFTNQCSVITMTSTPKTYKRNVRAFEKIKNVYVALGLHPQIANERYKELDLLLEYIKEAAFIGEVGLDFSPNYYQYADKQLHIFKTILEKCDSSEKKIFSVHCVRSADKVLEAIGNNLSNNVYILHWFSGSETALKKAVDLGCFFSINQKMMNSKNGTALINSMPSDRILLESDAPFTMMFKTNNEQIAYMENTTRLLSARKNKDMFKQITLNSKKILEDVRV